MTLENKLSTRLTSLDVFRGLTVASMILVNNPGSWDHVLSQFEHSAWNGCTFTDLVFPFFLWISGLSITISFANRSTQEPNHVHSVRRIFLRFLILFFLGLFINGFPFGLLPGSPNFSLATIRIPGELQRIAVCYIIVSLITIYAKLAWRLFVIILLLAGIWILIKTISVPGYGSGVLGAEGSLHWYIDSILLHNHTWKYAPVPGFDPEGILSTISSITTTLFGALTGQLILSKNTPKKKMLWLLIFGGSNILLGLYINNWLPINKQLWTPSFAIFTAGIAEIVYALCYWLVDIKKYQKIFRPLQIYGLNSLVSFVVSIIIFKASIFIFVISSSGAVSTIKSYCYTRLFLPVIGNEMYASLAHAITFELFMYIIAYILYRSKIIIKA